MKRRHADPAPTAVTPGAIPNHPALRAWRTRNPSTPDPAAIEVLKDKRKSLVCRLRGVGPNGSAIIAKRSHVRTARTERTIYEEIFPRLPLRSPRYLGHAVDEDPWFRWFFLEDVGEVPYDPSLEEHRELATRWMSTLHTSGESVAAVFGLTDRGPAYHARHLRLAWTELREAYARLVLSPGDRALLWQILSLLDAADSRWTALERLCEGAPETLLHVDLKENNIRILETDDGPVFLPIDWEMAGWGVPAIDLVKCPDIALYAELVRPQWPALTLEKVACLRDAGLVFRPISAICWELSHIDPTSLEWPLRRMRTYRTRLQDALDRLDAR